MYKLFKSLLFCKFLLLAIHSPILAQDLYPQYNNLQYDANAAYTEDALNRLYIVGLQYLNSGELTQAEISFRSILTFPYRSKDWRTTRYYKGKANFYLGDIYFIQKNYLKSSSNYQIVAQEYAEIEEYSNSLYKLGRSLILGGKENEGIVVLKDYNYNYGSRDGLADNVLYWIAQGYMGLADYTAALQILHQILRDFPNSTMAYDIRILIAKLETSFPDNIPMAQQNTIQETILSSREKAEKIAQEKELIDRIKQLLTLKEQLLQIKERKLKLLEKIRQTRIKALQTKNIITDDDSMNLISQI